MFNFALVIVLIGFGEQPTVIAIYASAAALVEIIAALVWVGARRQERRPLAPGAERGQHSHLRGGRGAG